MEQLQEAIMALAPDMSLDDYAAAMADAMTAATLAGRYDVLQQSGSEA